MRDERDALPWNSTKYKVQSTKYKGQLCDRVRVLAQHVTCLKLIFSMQGKLMIDLVLPNVWEIMRCPEYTLKCNKNFHLPA